MALGLSMIGMIRLTPEESVRWYFPKRSMIIVCACWTMRIPRATIDIANSAMAAGTMSEPMLSIASHLLIDVEGRPFHSHDDDPRARLERRGPDRRRPPSLTLDQHPSLPGDGVDALRDDPHLAGERVHVGPDGRSAGMQVPQQERADAHEGQQGARGEAQRRHRRPRDEEGDDPGGETPDGYREQPEAGRQHLGHEQKQGGDEPDLPSVHGGNLARYEEAGNASSVFRSPSSVRVSNDLVQRA